MKGRKGEEVVRVAAININGCQDEVKRNEMINEFAKGKLDVLGVSETHIRGQGSWYSEKEEECELWKNLTGGCVLSGRGDGERGKGREGCAIVMSESIERSN